MSFLSAAQIDQVILPASRDIGGFAVRRALPTAKRRTVGPFVFLDSFGPVMFSDGEGLDTLPHPHIGLSTLTYLLEGELVHRDSAGFVQTIRPGEVNLMTAGRGIVHSERSSAEFRQQGGAIFGFQSWIALPTAFEEAVPDFQHVGMDQLPTIEGEGIDLKLIAGTLHGRRAPTRSFSDLVNAHIRLVDGARYRIDSEHIERALYVIKGKIEVMGQEESFGRDQLIVFKPGDEIVLKAMGAAEVMLVGGEPLPERRHIYWNFVSSRKDRVEQAARDWHARLFPEIPGETGFVPLSSAPPVAT